MTHNPPYLAIGRRLLSYGSTSVGPGRCRRRALGGHTREGGAQRLSRREEEMGAAGTGKGAPSAADPAPTTRHNHDPGGRAPVGAGYLQGEEEEDAGGAVSVLYCQVPFGDSLPTGLTHLQAGASRCLLPPNVVSARVELALGRSCWVSAAFGARFRVTRPIDTRPICLYEACTVTHHLSAANVPGRVCCPRVVWKDGLKPVTSARRGEVNGHRGLSTLALCAKPRADCCAGSVGVVGVECGG